MDKALAGKTAENERLATRVADFEEMLRLKATAVDAEEQVNVNTILTVNAVAGDKKTFEELCDTLKQKVTDKDHVIRDLRADKERLETEA